MAKVAIDTRRLDSLHNVCVKTGESTATTRSQDFADIPGWTLLLIFWGLIPFLIAAGFARRKITVELPASAGTLRRIRLVDLGAVAGLALAVGILVATLVSDEVLFAWAGIGVALITLVAVAGLRRMVWVTGRLDDETLWLYGVHPAFAEQAQAMAPRDIEQRLSTNRWAIGLLLASLIVLGVLVLLLFQVRV